MPGHFPAGCELCAPQGTPPRDTQQHRQERRSFRFRSRPMHVIHRRLPPPTAKLAHPTKEPPTLFGCSAQPLRVHAQSSWQERHRPDGPASSRHRPLWAGHPRSWHTHTAASARAASTPSSPPFVSPQGSSWVLETTGGDGRGSTCAVGRRDSSSVSSDRRSSPRTTRPCVATSLGVEPQSAQKWLPCAESRRHSPAG